MILQSLHRYYERKRYTGELAPEGFEPKEIPFVLVIDAQGRLVQIDDTRTLDGKKKVARSFRVPQSVKRSMGVSANLLWDNVEYVLGIVREDGKPERVAEQHMAFTARLRELAGKTDDAALSAVIHFLESDPVAQVDADPLALELRQNNPNVTFRMVEDLASTLVCQRPAVIDALTGSEPDADAITAPCLVRGVPDATARLHPAIKGVWGAQTAGANIVSFNLDAFNSFGKTQSYNAPVGEKATFAYTTALNHLLRKGSPQRLQVGDASTVFWSEEDSSFEDMFAALFGVGGKDDPDRGIAAVRDLLTAPDTGIYRDAPGNVPFCLLGLAPNAARIAIRFWHVAPVREFAMQLRTHFEDIEVVHAAFEKPYLPLWRLLTSTALQGESKNVPPNLAGDTMRAVVTGTPYPAALLQAAVRRCRAEQAVGYARAAVIKACINRQARFQSTSATELTMSLDPDNRDPAYRLGRLFAALERIQGAAQPGINATIRERYYGAASSSPASVFPILLRLKNHHLAKLDTPALKTWFEKVLGRIFDGIAVEFPRHLDLHGQGRFAIGYYHQQQDFFARKSDNDTPTTDDTAEDH